MGYIPIRQLAEELRKDRSALLKFIKKQNIKLFTLARAPGSACQPVSALSEEDAQRVRDLLSTDTPSVENAQSSNSRGWFYAIQVIPEFAPNRIKLGYTGDLASRLAAHRTAAPTARILRTWPSKSTWEVTAIDSITRVDSSLILSEVFEFGDLDAMIARADDFFNVMSPP